MSLLSNLNPNKWLKKALGFTDSGLGNVFGGMFNDLTGTTESARKQFEYNQALQNDAQQFAQWQMGNAHQQEVDDLKAAGLNPVLSSGGSGASAGGVSSNSTGPGASTGINPITAILGMVETMNSTAKINADIKNQTNKTNAEVSKLLKEAGFTGKQIEYYNKYGVFPGATVRKSGKAGAFGIGGATETEMPVGYNGPIPNANGGWTNTGNNSGNSARKFSWKNGKIYQWTH